MSKAALDCKEVAIVRLPEDSEAYLFRSMTGKRTLGTDLLTVLNELGSEGWEISAAVAANYFILSRNKVSA